MQCYLDTWGRVWFAECIDSYVSANAMKVRHSPCYKCPQGLGTRSRFAET